MYWLRTTTPDLGLVLAQPRRGLDALVGPGRRHPDVGDHDVGRLPSRSARGAAGRSAARPHQLEVGLAVDDPRDALPQQGVVLRQYHPDARHALPYGSATDPIGPGRGRRTPWCWHPRAGTGWHPWWARVRWRHCIPVEQDVAGECGAVIERGFGVACTGSAPPSVAAGTGYLSLVVLVGLVGGLGLGSLAAARRTQSSFSTFLAATNPSDLHVSIYGGGGRRATPTTPRASRQAIARLPGVAMLRPAIVLTGAPLDPRRFAENPGHGAGLSRRQRQRSLLHPGPHGGAPRGAWRPRERPDEIMMAPVVAKLLGFHVGQVIPLGFYSDAQQSLPGFGTKAVPPGVRGEHQARRTGVAELRDRRGRRRRPSDVRPPDARVRSRRLLAHKGEQFTGRLTFGIQTQRWDHRRCRRSSARSRALIPPRLQSPANTRWRRCRPRPTIAQADLHRPRGLRGRRPAGGPPHRHQLIARRFRAEAGGPQDPAGTRRRPGGHRPRRPDRHRGARSWPDRCLAGRRRRRTCHPLAPLGPGRVRSIPTAGFSFDWTVLGFGVAGPGHASRRRWPCCWRTRAAPHRVALRPRLRSTTGARVVDVAGAGRAVRSGVVGVRMALEPRGGPRPRCPCAPCCSGHRWRSRSW